MGYFVGDIPAQPLVIEPARSGEPLDLDPFDPVVEVEVLDPDGVPILTPGFLGTIEALGVGDKVIVIEWPEVSPFTTAGIYTIRVVAFNAATEVRERIPSVRIVADTEDGWHTLETAREDWRDAPVVDSWLYEVLWTAKHDVLAYAPELAEGQRPPLNYRRAQLMQARNLWNAGKVDPATGAAGEDTFILRPYPLDWTVKQVLRPKRAVKAIG